jgi:single-strand DNA-binding protein
MNNVVLMGRICATPELKYTANQVPVTSFNLAVDRRFNKEETDFITIVAWRQTAEFICKYFSKGSLIALQGAIQSRTYDDKYGNKRTVIEVVADQVYFTGEKRDSQPQAVGQTQNDDFEEISDDEDLPF